MPKRSSKKKTKAIPDESTFTAAKKADAEVYIEASGSSEKHAEKNPHAVALGRLGGIVGGKVRAARLTAEERSRIAKKAAQARWTKSE
jgi:hypothetical protein